MPEEPWRGRYLPGSEFACSSTNAAVTFRPCHRGTALTIARIPALIASGSLCHAAITVARPGSVLPILAKQEPKTES